MKIVNLIRERRSEGEIYPDSFLAEDYIVNTEQALRDAIAEFTKTEGGIKAIKDSCEGFNWGDAVNDVPEETWNKHGITSFKNGTHINAIISEIVTVIVNQDEILFDGEDYINATSCED